MAKTGLAFRALPRRIVAIIVGLSLTASAQAQTIFRDSFDTPPAAVGGFGTYMPIPGTASDWFGGALSLRANNRTMYLNVIEFDRVTFEERSILRQLDPNGPTPRWRSWDSGAFASLHHVQPSTRSYEGPDELRAFHMDIDSFGSVAINTGTPAFTNYPLPEDPVLGTPEDMVQDYSSIVATWASYWDSVGDATVIKVRAFTQVFEPVARLPGLAEFMEPDPTRPVVWVVIEQKLHEVGMSGLLRSFDAGALGADSPIRKVRFSAAGVVLSAGARTFIIRPQGQLQLLYTQQAGLDFAINDSHLFVNDGTVVRLSDGSIAGTLIPPPPGADRPQSERDSYWTNRTVLQAGGLEIGTDPLATQLYAWVPYAVVSVPLQVYPISGREASRGAEQ